MAHFVLTSIFASKRVLGAFLGIVFASSSIFSPAMAVETFWIAPEDGQFDHAANWSNGVPTPLDTGIFVLSSTYAVSTFNDVDTGALGFLGGQITLDLNGHALSADGVAVGYIAGPDVVPWLTVKNGTASFGRTFIGNDGRGKLVIRDGANVDAGEFFILGYWTDDEGTVEVIGPNSRLTTPASTIGGGLVTTDDGLVFRNTGGTGTLNILDGGQVASTQIALGFSGSGYSTVSGQGSRWDISEGLAVGYFQSGDLNIVDGGVVEAPLIIAAGYAGSSGVIHVSGAGSLLSLAGPVETSIGPAGTLQLGGTPDIVNAIEQVDRGPGGTASLVVSDSGEVHVPNTLTLWSDATVDVSAGGILRVGEATSGNEGQVLIGSGGTLEGTGTIVGDVVLDGGVIRPGFSAGTLTINGDLTSLGVLELELGQTSFDQLLVSGLISLGGVLEINLLDGFTPTAGQSFSLLSFASLTDEGFVFDFSDALLGEHLSWDTSTFTTDGTLRVVAVPEPSSLALAGMALLAGLFVWRKNRC